MKREGFRGNVSASVRRSHDPPTATVAPDRASELSARSRRVRRPGHPGRLLQSRRPGHPQHRRSRGAGHGLRGLELLRRGAQEGARRPSSRRSPRADVEDQHGRPQLVPGEHHPLPPGQPGRRVHLVRRLPHAVLRGAGPGDADRRRLGGASAPTTPTRSRRRRPATTASSTSCRSTTTRGRCSTARASGQEKGYAGPEDARRAQDARRAR